jgi:hypothetical protein
MKRFTLSVFTLLFVSAVAVHAQSHAEEDLYKELMTTNVTKGPAALDGVLKNSEVYSTTILYAASAAALREKRLEDAGFLYYAARIRLGLDRELFPPTGKGGDSPMLVFGATQQQIGMEVNPAITADPKIYAAVIARLKTWRPEVNSKYEPGWKYSEKLNEARVLAKNESDQKRMIHDMADLSTLLNDPVYFAAFKTAQDFNLKFAAPDRPSKDAYDKAVVTLKRIETEKKLKGFSEAISKHEAQLNQPAKN